MDIKRSPMWPTVFYVVDWQDAARHRGDLLDLCYRLKATDRQWDLARRAKSGLFESTPDFFSHAEGLPAVNELMQFCGAAIATLFERDVYFPESWCHVTNDGGFHDAHTHIDFVRGICGIYYLQCGQCTVDPPNGINRFYSPNVFEENDVADFQPVEGRLLLFPGYVRHSALPYRGNDDRVVISFNARFGDPAEGSGG